MLAQDRLDLPQFDPETVDLDLVVHPAEKLDVAVGRVTGQIAGLVETSAGIIAERIWNEACSRQSGTVQVATGDPRATDVQLPRHTDRRWLQVPVQDVELRVDDRTADGHRAFYVPGPGGLVDATPHDRLRRTIFVDQHRVRGRVLPKSNDLAQEIFSSDDESPRPAGRFRRRQLLAEQLQVGRCDLDQAEVRLLPQCRTQRLDPNVFWEQSNSATSHQWRKQSRDRQVEGDG